MTIVAALTLPEPPTGLTATAVGPTRINLSWTAPSDNGGDEITAYRVEYATLTDQAWTWQSAPLEANTGNANTTYTDDGTKDQDADADVLNAGTPRQYRVAALNSAGGMGYMYSNPAIAVTTAATVPGAPKGLRVTPSGPTVINLVWSDPTDTGGAMIMGYQIERSRNGRSWTGDPVEKNIMLTDDGPLMVDDGTYSYADAKVPTADTRWYYRCRRSTLRARVCLRAWPARSPTRQ